MGQAITTLIGHLVGRIGGQNLFDRYWKALQAMLTLLRGLLGKATGKRKSIDPEVKGKVLYGEEYCSSGIIDLPESSSINITNDVTTIGSGSGSVDEDGSQYLSAAEEHMGLGKLGPYRVGKKILLVGEGDFSFSASLAVAFGDASNIIATSLDSFEFLIENYKKAESNISVLTSRGCKVIHGVDATSMAINHPQLRSLKFHFIIFNFPKATFSNPKPQRDAQISKHQELVTEFLVNAKKMIYGDGQIHITHQCSGRHYLEWNIEMLGSSQGLLLVEESPFTSREYPGYCAKFGSGGDGTFGCNPAITYKFQLVASHRKKKTRRKKKQL